MDREKVIDDILHWTVEDREHDITDEEIGSLKIHLKTLSNEELEDYWVNTVGIWLNSRDGLNADTQWRKIENGEDTDYGFIY